MILLTYFAFDRWNRKNSATPARSEDVGDLVTPLNHNYATKKHQYSADDETLFEPKWLLRLSSYCSPHSSPSPNTTGTQHNLMHTTLYQSTPPRSPEDSTLWTTGGLITEQTAPRKPAPISEIETETKHPLHDISFEKPITRIF